MVSDARVRKFLQTPFEVEYLIFSICKRGKKVFWLEHEADISEMPADWFLIFARGKTTNMSLLLSAFLNFPSSFRNSGSHPSQYSKPQASLIPKLTAM